jgi:hypothetical protein
MGEVIEVFMLPFDEGDCPELKGLGTYGDIFQFLPDYEAWKADPAKFGLRKSASRNSWHEVTLHQICQGLGLVNLEFVISDHFSCLDTEDLSRVLADLNIVINSLSEGIPDLGKYESPEIEYLRRPENLESFEKASPSYDVQYDDSATSFYSFLMSLNECIQYCINNHKSFLFMRGLP